ncbi:MAG TPA: uroporphyrinogen decarboxylase family protein [Candidatus Lokiarchaeia archaeon]|nr:uroporphyrinogen decarboxylase family protein [Candidatus Lokiarchaeia archaeon]
MSPSDTCENEQLIMAALRREVPEKVPSFVQSIMTRLTQEYLERFEETIDDDNVILTKIGDFTVYKGFGFASHWSGTPEAKIVVDDALRDELVRMEEECSRQGHPEYRVNDLGSIRATNKITNWFVEPGIKTDAQMRFFLDHLAVKPPPASEVEAWREGRRQCMDADFVPFASHHVVVEPNNTSVSFGLTAKLMRKNPMLLNEWFDFIIQLPELSFKAAVDAGAKLFCTADDCAYKTGPMFHPAQYREFVTPRAKCLCDLVHDAGGLIFMHTDGFIDPIMDCFIDAGYDAVQPIETTSMRDDQGESIRRVKQKWGNKLAVIGNCDTTAILSFGTPEDVRVDVHRCFREARGKEEEIAGYVFAASGSLHDKICLDNALAMMDEYKKLRDNEIPI